jgi:hypothetical protein
MRNTMGQLWGWRQVPQKSLDAPGNDPRLRRLTILKLLDVSNRIGFSVVSVHHAIDLSAFSLRFAVSLRFAGGRNGGIS